MNTEHQSHCSLLTTRQQSSSFLGSKVDSRHNWRCGAEAPQESIEPDLQDLVSSQLQLTFEDVDILSSHDVTMSDGKLRNLIAFIHKPSRKSQHIISELLVKWICFISTNHGCEPPGKRNLCAQLEGDNLWTVQWENEHVWQENQTLMADIMWIMSIMQSYGTCSNHVCTAPGDSTKDSRQTEGTKGKELLLSLMERAELKESSKNTDELERFQDSVYKILKMSYLSGQDIRVTARSTAIC